MFESFRPPDRAVRLRNAAAAPFAALLALQLYETVQPLFGRAPAPLFLVMQLLMLAGTLAGVAAIARALGASVDDWSARDVAWLIAAVAITLVAFFSFARLTFPWVISVVRNGAQGRNF